MSEVIREFDENNNCIHYKDSDGDEYWREYDKSNNRTHHRDVNGFEYWRKYDINNNEIHYRNNEGLEEWYKYTSGEKIKISKQEFEQIKRINNFYLNNNKVSRFELMDI